MAVPQLAISPEEIEAFCLRHGAGSDIDVLVEFEPGRVPGYFDLAGMELEFSEMLGRKVDLRTAQELTGYFRDKVVTGAVAQYERH